MEGLYKPEEALKLLLAASGLSYEFVGARAVAIRGAKSATAGKTSSAVRDGREAGMQMAQVEQAVAAQLPASIVGGEESGGSADGKE